MIKTIYIFKHDIENMNEALDFELGQIKELNTDEEVYLVLSIDKDNNNVEVVISDKTDLDRLIICYSNELTFLKINCYSYSINMYAVDAGDLRMAILKYQLKDDEGEYKYTNIDTVLDDCKFRSLLDDEKF